LILSLKPAVLCRAKKGISYPFIGEIFHISAGITDDGTYYARLFSNHILQAQKQPPANTISLVIYLFARNEFH